MWEEKGTVVADGGCFGFEHLQSCRNLVYYGTELSRTLFYAYTRTHQVNNSQISFYEL